MIESCFFVTTLPLSENWLFLGEAGRGDFTAIIDLYFFSIYIYIYIANSTCIKFCRFWVRFSSTSKIDRYLNLIINSYNERVRHQLKLYFKTIFFFISYLKKFIFLFKRKKKFNIDRTESRRVMRRLRQVVKGRTVN